MVTLKIGDMGLPISCSLSHFIQNPALRQYFLKSTPGLQEVLQTYLPANQSIGHTNSGVYYHLVQYQHNVGYTMWVTQCGLLPGKLLGHISLSDCLLGTLSTTPPGAIIHGVYSELQIVCLNLPHNPLNYHIPNTLTSTSTT